MDAAIWVVAMFALVVYVTMRHVRQPITPTCGCGVKLDVRNTHRKVLVPEAVHIIDAADTAQWTVEFCAMCCPGGCDRGECAANR